MDGYESPPFSPVGIFDGLSASNSENEEEEESSLEEEEQDQNFNAVPQEENGDSGTAAVTPQENHHLQHPPMMNGHHHVQKDNDNGDMGHQSMLHNNSNAQHHHLVAPQLPSKAPPAPPSTTQNNHNDFHENSNAAPLDQNYPSAAAVLEDHSGTGIVDTQRPQQMKNNPMIPTSDQQQSPPQHLAAAAPSVSLAPTPVSVMTNNNDSNNNVHSNVVNSHQNNNQLKRAPSGNNPAGDTDVIELLDDDDDNDDNNNNHNYAPPTMNGASAADPQSKRPRISPNNGLMPPQQSAGQAQAASSYQSRLAAIPPSWMQPRNSEHSTVPPAAGYSNNNIIVPGMSLGGYNTHIQQHQYPSAGALSPHNLQPNPVVYPGGGSSSASMPPYYQHQHHHHRPPPYAAVPAVHHHNHHNPHVAADIPPSASYTFDKPNYVDLPAEFVPTWAQLLPADMIKPTHPRNRKKAYQLSLISLTEFTITGLPLYPEGPPTPVAGLRKTIKQVSKEHGKAIFEKDRGSHVDGRWKIPIGAYHAFVAFLQGDPNCIRLEPIPQMQLKIASLGAAREEKGLPSAQELNKKGVPLLLCKTLAPFQRGGVDFVLERSGRALLADEMGLGKTIQAVASMSVYHREWPLLVLTPSGARYHWESEFRNWLGVIGADAKKNTIDFHGGMGAESETGEDRDYCDFNLLENHQINVLTSSKAKIFPTADTRVVICSYGLAPMLAESNKITPGMFPCAIADESHMLKNMKSKRTSMLVPILNACNRVVLLSGTPALAKPLELWPQLKILQISGQPGFWDNEQQFHDKYVKRNSATHRAELATMLKGTVMIRRLKENILKDMPRKVREKAIARMVSDDMKRRMQDCMELLREGKGVLGKLARQHSSTVETSLTKPPEAAVQESTPNGSGKPAPVGPHDEENFHQILNNQRHPAMAGPEAQLEQEIKHQYQQGQNNIHDGLLNSNHLLNPNEVNNFVMRMESDLRAKLRVSYLERLQMLRGDVPPANEDEAPTRATVLSKMYSLTGQCKVPPVSEFLKKWLNDPTKGKICVFAHHIFVLDEVAKSIGLSNSGEKGTHKFIRIDGSTTPRSRQEQIDAFQNDPSIRVAMLGITAAGVAVTLTASSHVLFAELFWTPAIMIQAEDRCHRIGQQARVKCLYFVAKGTLDDILWKLIEKKFKELGEFVEGKEKLKMVVDKVYNNEEELASIFNNTEGDESDNDDGDFMQPDQAQSGGDDVLPLDNELEHDIEELGREEQEMLVSVDRDSDDGDAEVAAASSTTNEVTEIEGKEKVRGRSEEDAIALSDSEDEEEAGGDSPSTRMAVNLERNPTELNTYGTLPDCKIYKMWLRGPSMGVEIGFYKSRLVVSRKRNERMQRLGEDCKPDVGDILVAVGHQLIPLVDRLEDIMGGVKKILENGKPTEMWFAEDAEFQKHYILTTGREKEEKKRQRENRSNGIETSNGGGGAPDDAVILIDD